MQRKTKVFAAVENLLDALFTGETEEVSYKTVMDIAQQNPHIKIISNPGKRGEMGLVLVDRYNATLDISFSTGGDRSHVVSYNRGVTETKEKFIASCVESCDMTLIEVFESKAMDVAHA